MRPTDSLTAASALAHNVISSLTVASKNLSAAVSMTKIYSMESKSVGELIRHHRRTLLVLSLLSGLGPFSFDTYLPALPGLAKTFGIASSTAQLTLTGSLVGGAVGQLLLGLASDARGRRNPLLSGLLGFAFASALCAVAPNISVLIIGRALQGFCGSAALITSRAVVRDLFEGAQAAHAFSRQMVILGLAPIVAPLAGSALLTFGSWRTVFWFLTVLSLGLLAASYRWLGETLPADRRQVHNLREVFAGWGALVRDPLFRVATITGMMISAWLLVYLADSSFALQHGFDMSPQEYAAVFAFCAMGITVAGQINHRLLPRFGVVTMLRAGFVASAVAAAPLLLSLLAGTPPLAPVMAGIFLACSLFGVLTPNAMALAVAHHPRRAGSAAGLSGLLQSLTGAVVAPVAGTVAGASLPAFCRTFGGLLLASAVIGLLLARKIQLP